MLESYVFHTTLAVCWPFRILRCLLQIIPLSETPDKFNDVYIKLRQDDSPLTFLYSLRYGEVRDKDTFETVMGMIK